MLGKSQYGRFRRAVGDCGMDSSWRIEEGPREEEGFLGEVYRGIGTSNGASSFFRRMFGDMVSGLFLRVGWDLGVLGKLGWAQDLVVDTSLTIMGWWKAKKKKRVVIDMYINSIYMGDQKEDKNLLLPRLGKPTPNRPWPTPPAHRSGFSRTKFTKFAYYRVDRREYIPK